MNPCTLRGGSHATSTRRSAPRGLTALQPKDIPEPPALPDPVESGEAIAPQVTIIQRDDATIEEYRVNGVLYSVKIIPVVGPAYYLVDRDGDGQLESRVNDITRDIPVPLWLIFSW